MSDRHESSNGQAATKEEVDDNRTLTRVAAEASLTMEAPLVGRVSLGSNWERRLQTLAMFSCSLYFIIPSIFAMWGITIFFLFGHRDSIFDVGSPSLTTGLVALYLGFIFVLDRSPTTGLRSDFLRYWKWWNYSCDYLPLLLVKTADLPVGQGQKYVLGYHPHGIISVGCFGAFATNGARTLDLTAKVVENDDRKAANKGAETTTPVDKKVEKRGFSSLFPGLDRRVVTLPQNFNTPFLREYFLCLGAVTSSKESFRTILKRPHTALVVVVGGAAESLKSDEGAMDLILESRKGFCREAILAQASLVPVLGFGENDIYTVIHPGEKDFMATVQDWMKRLTGLGMPIFRGRSILFKDVGIMPQRKPVVVVVGEPLKPPTCQDKFDPQIDRKSGEASNDDGETLIAFHAKYVEALENLYKKHKDAPWNVPGRDRRRSLAIVR